jgi:hypothetical protein
LREFTCDQCGKTFWEYPSRRKLPLKFCSRECGLEWQTRHAKNPKRGRAKIRKVRENKQTITLPCSECNVSFQRYASVVNQAKYYHFCCRACYRLWQKRTRNGTKIEFSTPESHDHPKPAEPGMTVLVDFNEKTIYNV